jgi:galactose oxidase-like protein
MCFKSCPSAIGLLLTAFCAVATLKPVSAAAVWAPPQVGRSGAGMAYDSVHQQVVLFGGTNSSGFLNDTWLWNGTTWTEQAPTASPSARSSFAMAYDAAHSQVVLFGGNNGSVLADTWVWDGTNWTQKSPTLSPSARSGHVMAYDSTHQQVVLFSGTNGTTNFSDTWIWDGTNWTLKSPATSPPSRANAAMAYDSTHAQAVLFGGFGGGTYLSDTWLWDGTNWTQHFGGTGPQPEGVEYAAMVYDSAQQQVVMFGGLSPINGAGGDTWLWNGTNWSPAELVNKGPASRYSSSMAFDAAHGQVVLFGGNTTYSLNFNDTWLFGTDWTENPAGTNPPARYFHAMAYDAVHGQVVLFGGFDGTNYLSDTWVWDGANWNQKLPATSPSARDSHAMVYDSLHQQVVLFGGKSSGASPLADTWLWDGSNWTIQSPSPSPPARYWHAMAYDSGHQQTVLFGGSSGGGSDLGDTWVWNGVTWTQKSPGTNPPARYSHAMAYNASLAQTVLFGGTTGITGTIFRDTWVWSGTNWTQQSPSTSPSARSSLGMADDGAHAQVVVFGGINGSTVLEDTWLWNGTTWQPFTPESPTGRFAHAMAFDAAHHQAVLFGGDATTPSPSPLLDTWVFEGGFVVSPNTGSGTGPQVFTANYFDYAGGSAAALQSVYLDFGSTADSPHDCMVAYAPGSNSLYLFNDAGTGVVSGSLTLGGGGSLSNSQCTLSGGGTPATLFGINLTVPFTIQFLPGYGGLKNIWGVAQDLYGLQSDGGVFDALGTWTPSASTPGVISVSPVNGTGAGPITFSAIYSDNGGANDLEAVYLDFGSVGGFASHNCIVVYTPAFNELYLFNDNGTGALGPIALGAGGGTLSNSQCTLSSGTTAASVSGDTLTVPFNITFLNGYGGKKFIFGLSQTYAGTQSSGGAQTLLGTWEPATSTPAVGSVNPTNGTGLSQIFTATYSDTGGANDLQVVYLSFGASFQAANSCNVGFQPGNNELFLLSDDNSTAATVGEGGPGSVSNSQCTLSGGSSPATESGTSLTVPFTITFKSGFTGTQNMFGLAQTYDGTQSAIKNLGSWTP